MKTVPVEEAVGLTLCHDITEIIPGVKKGPAFRRGHVVRPEDIPHLLRLGKQNLYVWDTLSGEFVHEDDAAARIAKAVAGPGVSYGQPKEGRINFTAGAQGLFRVNPDRLLAFNSIPEVTIATIHDQQEVQAGSALAGTRVIPLVVPESTLAQVEKLAAGAEPLLQVLPFRKFRVGIVTTGSEVYSGRIKDGFGPVLRKKFESWGSEILGQSIVPDDPEQTLAALRALLEQGAEMLCVTGGMSVDPDDKTPAAIRSLCDKVISYGAPVFPGAMFMLGYLGQTPVMGLPGCVMYQKASIFDLIVPRILAGQRIRREEILALGHGGFCLSCPECAFPVCGFGKY